MKRYESSIVGLGSYLPETELLNKKFEKWLDTSDLWIKRRTGISKRHIVNARQLTSDLAILAAQKAMDDASIIPEEIDMIVVSTTTGDRTFPSCATIVQSALGCKNAFAFDVQAACSGFVYGLAVANNFIKSGDVKRVLLIGADSMSKIVDYGDRSTCILFGDGAGAVILEAHEDTDRFIKTQLYSDGDTNDLLYTDGGVALSQTAGHIVMDGAAVFDNAIRNMVEAVNCLLEKNGLGVNDIDLLIPHQANVRIIDALASRLEVDPSKVISTVHLHANTSAASIPLAWDHVWDEHSDSKLIVLVTVGAGMTWGAALIKL